MRARKDSAGDVTLADAGRVDFLMSPAVGTSVFGLFSQTLGTFNVGQRLPGIPFD